MMVRQVRADEIQPGMRVREHCESDTDAARIAHFECGGGFTVTAVTYNERFKLYSFTDTKGRVRFLRGTRPWVKFDLAEQG